MSKRIEKANKLVWLLTTFFFSAITIFESYTWGKFLLAAAVMLIFFVDVIIEKGIYHFHIGAYHKFIAVFTIYILLSTIWGISRQDCITKFSTFVQILVLMSVIYNHYYRFDNVESLLNVVKWSSYIISIYSIFYYGLDFIIKMATAGTRIENSYTNINTIGMLAAIGIILQIDEILRKHKVTPAIIFCVPSFGMVISTQSRKALLILVIGVFMVFISRNHKKGRVLKNIIGIVLIVVAGIILLKVLSSVEIFAGINERMKVLLAVFSENGNMGDLSMRKKLISLGVEIFKKNPIFGIGIGCPHIIAKQKLGYDAYLHNGFVECLAGGGIVGFVIYYFSYVYLIFKLYKYRKYKDSLFSICLILIIIFLFRDYAMVSMYSKVTYFYFMISFLEVRKMQVNAGNCYIQYKKDALIDENKKYIIKSFK